MAAETKTIGRTKTVLVFGRGPDQKGLISAVVARRMRFPGRKRLEFDGAVKFSRSVMSHTRRMILPIIDEILARLGLSKKDFAVSAVNLGAASSLDVGVSVSGLSADTAVFLALLSEALQIPLADDFVSTGHIASVEGDIRAVKAIPCKLDAAIADGSTHRFMHPDFEKDGSLAALLPQERDQSIAAIMAASDSIRTKAVRDIAQLAREVFNEEDIVQAGLQEGYFGVSGVQDEPVNPVSQLIHFFTHDSASRFWGTLQQHFVTGQCEKGKQLLRAFAEFFLRRQVYPSEVGTRLSQLLYSLPPSIRRLRIDFPILNTGLCIKLSQFAGEADYCDVLELFDSTHGRNLSHNAEAQPLNEPPPCDIVDSECVAFDTVVDQIDEQSIAREIGIPIDSARSSYILESSTVDTKEQVIDILQAFFVHLHRHMAAHPIQALDMIQVRSETIALLQRSFRDKGGEQAAFVRAMDGTQGGIRSVLDILTEQYKAEKRSAYVQRVFTDAIAVMEWDERVEFMRGAMKRLRPFLPQELRDEPAEKFVNNYEVIIQAYVNSRDTVNQLLRTI